MGRVGRLPNKTHQDPARGPRFPHACCHPKLADFEPRRHPPARRPGRRRPCRRGHAPVVAAIVRAQGHGPVGRSGAATLSAGSGAWPGRPPILADDDDITGPPPPLPPLTPIERRASITANSSALWRYWICRSDKPSARSTLWHADASHKSRRSWLSRRETPTDLDACQRCRDDAGPYLSRWLLAPDAPTPACFVLRICIYCA